MSQEEEAAGCSGTSSDRFERLAREHLDRQRAAARAAARAHGYPVEHAGLLISDHCPKGRSQGRGGALESCRAPFKIIRETRAPRNQILATPLPLSEYFLITERMQSGIVGPLGQEETSNKEVGFIVRTISLSSMSGIPPRTQHMFTSLLCQ